MSDHHNSGYEKSDVHVPSVLVVVVLSAIAIIASLVVVDQYFVYSTERAYYERVLAVQSEELREMRAQESGQLNSYGVVDAKKGVYRLPIERAMKIVNMEGQGR